MAKKRVCILCSKDGDVFEADRNNMRLNHLIREMYNEDMDEEAQSDDTTIPLPNVSSKDLKKVIEFCDYFHINPMKDIEKPLRSSNMEECVPKWYADFINLPKEEVFSLVMAANYLDNKQLLELCCAKVATFIKGRTPEEIRALFEIENDFSHEEEQRIREDNKWCAEFV